MNDLHKHINYEKLSSFSPMIRIKECKADVRSMRSNGPSGDDFNGEQLDHDNTQLFAVGAKVMLTYNLWTEASLANGACGKIVSILKPQDDCKASILLVNIPNYCSLALSPDHLTIVPITQTPRASSAAKGSISLTLAWVVTIHKAQGMTLDWVTVDLGQREFSSGLTFMALLCAKLFEGLRVHPFDLEHYKMIEKGKYIKARWEEFQRLQLRVAVTVV